MSNRTNRQGRPRPASVVLSTSFYASTVLRQDMGSLVSPTSWGYPDRQSVITLQLLYLHQSYTLIYTAWKFDMDNETIKCLQKSFLWIPLDFLLLPSVRVEYRLLVTNDATFSKEKAKGSPPKDFLLNLAHFLIISYFLSFFTCKIKWKLRL